MAWEASFGAYYGDGEEILIMKWLVILIVPLFFLDADLEARKNENFIKAVNNNSTFSYFTVITAKNLNTGEVKEVCTKGNFVSGALYLELKADYDGVGTKKVNAWIAHSHNRFFEFKSKKALDNIGFFEYDPHQLSKVGQEYNFDKISDIINKEKKFEIRLDDKKMRLFAHILFNRGYLTGENDCFGGALEYVRN